MKILGKNKFNKLWKFSQKGNLWRFIFAGNLIAGETRDVENKILYLFTFDFNTGKKFLTNYLFENGNYWITIEGGNNNNIYLTRFKNPELPYHTGILTISSKTGDLLWENPDYQFFFCTEERLFGVKQNYEKPVIAEINPGDGAVIKLYEESENNQILQLKRKSDIDLYEESANYPQSLSNNPPEEHMINIIKKEITNKKVDGEIEYIINNKYLMFNYYIENPVDTKDILKKTYKNTFCIYDAVQNQKLFEDVLNEKSGCNVPDNFFIKDDILIYLKEKKDILAYKL